MATNSPWTLSNIYNSRPVQLLQLPDNTIAETVSRFTTRVLDTVWRTITWTPPRSEEFKKREYSIGRWVKTSVWKIFKGWRYDWNDVTKLAA